MMGRNAVVGTPLGDLVQSQESSLLKILLTLDSTKTIANLRVQRLMGINSLDGKVTMETIPDKPNRSHYSCERYQFFLDAPFEIDSSCCNVMKKNPIKNYAKQTGRKPITAQMASESRLRTQQWLNNGCNGFQLKSPIINPMSFWFEQDVLAYIYENKLPINPVYGDVVIDYGNQLDGQMDLSQFGILELERPTLKTTGAKRTGCFACGFGMHRERCAEMSRIQNIIDYSNPNLADWMLRGGHFDENGLWKPYKGLGMWFIIEWTNLHGNLKTWYPNREHYLKTYMTDETRAYLENSNRTK